MSVALAGRSPTSFEIKSASLPLLALRLKSFDLDTLAAELTAQYGDKPGFFDEDALIIDLSALPCAEHEAGAETEKEWPSLDFSRLLALLHGHRLHPLAVRGGNAALMAAARQAGLLPAPDTHMRVLSEPEPPVELPEPGALIIDRPLRSGQQAYARGRDLVVMAMVNPGAEVIADGHIHIYAPLRGRAIAGARGWPGARIFAREMRPELVSIAGVYRTSEETLPPQVWGQAATVRLSSTDAGDKLIFEPVAA